MNWDATFWVVDVEGNGARPPEVVELALLEIQALMPTGNRRNWLIRPYEPISPMATRIHGIRNEDLANAPAFDEIADEVLRWLEGAAIVGHNVRVELDVLRRVLPDWEPVAAIDTLKLAKAVHPQLPSYGLSNLAKSLALVGEDWNQDRTGAHSASYDASLTAALLAKLIKAVPQERRSALFAEANILEAQRGLPL